MTFFVQSRLLVLIAASLTLGTGAALAGDPSERDADLACRDDLFAGYTPTFRSGDALPKEGVFAVALQPATDVVYFVRSSDEPAQGHGAIVTFENVPAGRYGIVLSEEARLAAVQHRPFLPVSIEQRMPERNCLGTAGITVEGGPLTLQISGVAAQSIMIAVMRLAD